MAAATPQINSISSDMTRSERNRARRRSDTAMTAAATGQPSARLCSSARSLSWLSSRLSLCSRCVPRLPLSSPCCCACHQQFRSLSHRFHGIEPGLKKQEKRLKKVQEEAQRLQALRETGGVSTKIAEKQKQLGTAHVVFDKKLEAALATGGRVATTAASAAAAGGDSQTVGERRPKHAGPFAQFGFGKGNFKKRKAAQEADSSAKKAHKAAHESEP